MRKIVLTALAAALAVSLYSGIASASTGLRASPAHSYVRFNRLEFGNAAGLIRCEVTLDVTLHASVAKRAGELAGLTRIGIGACDEGNSAGILVGTERRTGLVEQVYHVQYVSFAGTLPNISSVKLRVVNVVFWVVLGGVNCLTNGAISISGDTTGGNPATGMRVEATRIPLTGLCALGGSGTMTGTGSIFSDLAHTTAQRITIALI